MAKIGLRGSMVASITLELTEEEARAFIAKAVGLYEAAKKERS